MSIKVACAACEHRFAVADKFAGKSGKCPQCGGLVRVPDLPSAVGDSPTAPTGQARRAPAAPSVAVPIALQSADPDDPQADELPDYADALPRPGLGAGRPKRPGAVASTAKSPGKKSGQGRAGADLKTQLSAVPVHIWYAAGAALAVLVLAGGYFLVGDSASTSTAKSQASAKKTPGKQSSTKKSGGKAASGKLEPTGKSSTDASTSSFPNLTKAVSTPNAAPDSGGGFQLAEGLGERPKQPAAGAPLQDVYAYVERGIVMIEVFDESGAKTGLGSGFVIDASGLVATNYHVVDSAFRAQAVFNDGFHAPVEGYAALKPEEDLAILKLGAVPRNMVVLDIEYKDQPRKLEEVVAIGHPHDHQFAPFDGRVSRVVHTSELPADTRQFLRSLGGRVDHLWIEHKTGIAPGNSGGPLIDHRGHVLGINTWVNRELDLGYALSVQHIRALRANLLPKQMPLAAMRRKDPDDEDARPRENGLTVAKLRAMFDACAAKQWRPQSNQDYRQLQSLAEAITFAKWADERSNPADVDSDTLEALVKEADGMLADLAKVDWKAFQHVADVNRYASRAVGSTGAGVYLFATVEKTFSGEDGQPGAILSVDGGTDQDGTDTKIFVTLDRGDQKISAGERCMVLGVKIGTTPYGDNPLAKKRQHVIVTKCVLPYGK